jgi:deoxyinosine 3'endonuclease (endonuclease V)
MDTSRDPACGLVAAVDVHYLRSGEARAVAVVAADAAFSHVVAEHTAAVREVAPHRPGSSSGGSCRRCARFCAASTVWGYW